MIDMDAVRLIVWFELIKISQHGWSKYFVYQDLIGWARFNNGGAPCLPDPVEYSHL